MSNFKLDVGKKLEHCYLILKSRSTCHTLDGKVFASADLYDTYLNCTFSLCEDGTQKISLPTPVDYDFKPLPNLVVSQVFERL